MFSVDNSTMNRLRWKQRRERDKKRYVKVTTLIMLGEGHGVEETAKALGIASSTVYRYWELFEEKGLSDYLADNHVDYSGKLTEEQLELLNQELDTYLYINTKEVIIWVETEFGVSYTQSGMRDLLHRLGFVYKKTRPVPCKADPEKQGVFAEKLTQLIDEADKDPGKTVVFLDAVHPQHNTRAASGWIRKGHEFPIPANSGRKRINLNGALNAHDASDVTVVESERINAQSTVELLEKLVQKHSEKELTVVLDNARYYHNQIVKDWIKDHTKVKLLFLPPYSPNLNLIERLWRFMRKTVIDYYYYDTFSRFRKAILEFFKNISWHHNELETLLAPKFQIVGLE